MVNWEGITGQDHIIRYFSEVIRKKQVSHAYILEGDPGTPKEKIGLAFAKMLLCSEGTGCGKCPSCKALEAGSHPDVIHVTHEKPKLIRIDEIREQLVEDMGIRPYAGDYKIYLVDDAEKMNVAAQNALLKTLEEPPYYGVILLLTTNAEALLPTILSRSIRLKLISTGNGLERLSEEDQLAIFSVLKDAWQLDRTTMANAAADWKERGLSARAIGNVVRIWFRDVLVQKWSGDDRRVELRTYRSDLGRAAQMYDYAQINDILLAVDRAEERIDSNVNYELAMECLLAKMKQKPGEMEILDDGWGDILLPNAEELRYYESLQEDN